MKVNVTIVDDHKLFRKGIVSILQASSSIGLITEASNGIEAIEIIKKHQPDVVLMDISMPDMDGFECIRKLKNLNTMSKIIVLSMHNEEAMIVRLIEMGCNGYLLKDCDPEELILAVTQSHSKGNYFNAHVSKILLQNLKGQKEDVLNEREKHLLNLICQELTNAQIAEKMFLSVRTIEDYRKKLMEKLKIKSSTGLIKYALKNGLGI